MKGTLKSSFEYKIRLFRTLQEYIKEFSNMHNLNYNYIKDSFYLFLALNFLIIMLFLLKEIVLKALYKYYQNNRLRFISGIINLRF